MPIQVLFHQSDSVRACDVKRMKKAIRSIAEDYGWADGDISVALMSDAEIREINSKHLSHDYATDVISFDLSNSNDFLEGEIIASVETADREAEDHSWQGDDELLLYVIHGMLHIIGLGDKSTKETKAMREAEQYYLGLFNLVAT
jgi:probable rRNA maturation factor